MTSRKEIGSTEGEPAGEMRRKALAWILSSFGFLLAGLIAGSVLFSWKSGADWVVVPASFVGYLLAFRKGMLLWSPGIDRAWRYPFSVEPPAPPRSTPVDPDATIRIVRSDPPQVESPVRPRPTPVDSVATVRIVPPEIPRPPRSSWRVVR